MRDLGPRYLKTGEVARMLRVNPKTITRWVAAGKLSYIRTVGGHLRFPEADIIKIVEGEKK